MGATDITPDSDTIQYPRSRGPMARRLTTNQKILGSIPSVIILFFLILYGIPFCFKVIVVSGSPMFPLGGVGVDVLKSSHERVSSRFMRYTQRYVCWNTFRRYHCIGLPALNAVM